MDQIATPDKKKRIPYTDPAFMWSFSSLTTFIECPYQFKLSYIDNVDDVGNAYSDFGLYVHEILEKWALGELMDFELSDYYEDNYDQAMRHPYPPFPKTVAENAYKAGKEYFENFTGFGEDLEVVSAEEKFVTTMGNRRVRGIADIVLRNKSNNSYVVIDYKTKSAASMKKSFDLFKKQLYIYAKYVYDKFGEWPSLMMFNMIKDNGSMWVVEFNMKEYAEVVEWIEATVTDILAATEWPPGGSSFFCQYICSYRDECEFSGRFKSEWQREQDLKRDAANDKALRDLGAIPI